MTAARFATFVLTSVVAACGCSRSGAEPMATTLEQIGVGWRLLRGGEPYVVMGAAGGGSLELLAALGGNSTRTWGVDGLDAVLDQAERAGLSVCVGIWLGHERHGFDYANREAVDRQRAEAREAILRHRDHPAVLLWGIGNEMEGDGASPAIWSAVNDIAELAKALDPRHPTMTVIAEVGGGKVEALHRLCPAIDIVGINAYGGAASVPARYRAAGGAKPYIVTEFGPPGIWEVGRNAWGVPEDFTSTRKAEFYRAAHEAFAADTELCLGSYAFTWGVKQEATATWFGMLLPDGSRLAAADAMSERWRGAPPENRCPAIEALELVGTGRALPGAVVEARLRVTDPEGDPLAVEWVLQREAAAYGTGGDTEPVPTAYPEAVLEGGAEGARVRLPEERGPYRLFAYIRDGRGGAAVGNLPLLATDVVTAAPGREAALPLLVLSDDAPEPPFAASGYMGDAGDIAMDPAWRENPFTGATCLRAAFGKADGWGGVVWQDPANDWGDQPGGCDLTGATRLAFRARGQRGGEAVKFGYGLLRPDKPYFDTSGAEITVELTTEWVEYSLDLTGKDLARVKTGFFWVVGGQGAPVVFFLDEVRYE